MSVRVGILTLTVRLFEITAPGLRRMWKIFASPPAQMPSVEISMLFECNNRRRQKQKGQRF